MNRLKELRRSKNLTIVQLADKLHLPYETYRSYEADRNQADYDTLLQFADFFNVSVDFILGREELSPEERAAGASATKKESISPIEYEMLYRFREIGKRHGIDAQQALITVADKMM